MEQDIYDVVVVGGGPAALTAAMFTARRGLRTVAVAKDLGGQLALTAWIENYPGVDRAGGHDLSTRMRVQAERDGAVLAFDEAVGMERHEGNTWILQLASGTTMQSRVIILSFGLTPNDLGATGEEMLRGKGMYYCQPVDAPRQDGKRVAVIGGGSAAAEAALELSRVAERVYCVHRREALRAEQQLIDRLSACKNVEMMMPYVVDTVRGGGAVESMALKPADPETGDAVGTDLRDVDIDSVFVAIGHRTATTWLDGVVDRNTRGEIIVDRDCRTNVGGVFAAGDVTDITYKQAVISAGEGAKAGLQAFKYLQDEDGKPAIMIDWDARGKS
jgi:thioredoxin reductase (NADPH)